MYIVHTLIVGTICPCQASDERPCKNSLSTQLVLGGTYIFLDLGFFCPDLWVHPNSGQIYLKYGVFGPF